MYVRMYVRSYTHVYTMDSYIHTKVLDDIPCTCLRKEERSKQGQPNNKAKQHSTPKAVSFPKKIELPQVACTLWDGVGYAKSPQQY